MSIRCEYTELIEPHKLVPHPKNPNKHPQEQVERLAKIIDHQGQRSPIVVSKKTGFIVAGHGRLEAMQHLGWEKVAVDYQDFENEADEYAHMTADNAIGGWSTLDFSKINLDIQDLGPFDIELLALHDFKIEPMENYEETKEEKNGPSALDKLEKYLDKEFIEIKLEYSREEHERLVSEINLYMQHKNIENISDAVMHRFLS